MRSIIECPAISESLRLLFYPFMRTLKLHPETVDDQKCEQVVFSHTDAHIFTLAHASSKSFLHAAVARGHSCPAAAAVYLSMCVRIYARFLLTRACWCVCMAFLYVHFLFMCFRVSPQQQQQQLGSGRRAAGTRAAGAVLLCVFKLSIGQSI